MMSEAVWRLQERPAAVRYECPDPHPRSLGSWHHPGIKEAPPS